MGRIYTGRFDPFTFGIADIFQVVAGVDIPVWIHGWHLHQGSDFGEINEGVLKLETKRGVDATEGSAGSPAAEYPRDVNSPAAQCTIECANGVQAVAGAGTLDIIEEFGWNIRLPWDFFYLPDLRPRVDPGELWVLSKPGTLPTAPAIGGRIWVEEG